MSAAIKPNHDHKFTSWSGKSRGELVRKKRVSVNGNFVVFELQIVLLHLATSVCVWVSYQKMSLFMRAWIHTHLTSTTSTTSSHLPPRILFMTGLTVFDGL